MSMSDLEDESSSDGGQPLEGDDGELTHFLDVCWSCLGYRSDCLREVAGLHKSMLRLDKEDQVLMKASGWDPEQWRANVTACIQANGRFLDLFPTPDICAVPLGRDAWKIVTTVPADHRVASRNSSKVRSTLRQFVRDWAKEGAAERAMCYKPLLDAIMRRMPARGKGPDGKPLPQPRVLCPGSGLARLPFDLVRLGYAAQGNEFSYHMLLGSYLVLNNSPGPECHTIYPYVLSTSNRRSKTDHLRAVKVPDVSPGTALGPDSAFSMAAGEFVEVYKNQIAEWDAVLTCFFLDTAKNVFQYIRVIADIIREGGLWINLGPLLFHYADAPHEISIEPSWEEVKPAIEEYFVLDVEEKRDSVYTSNPGSLMSVRYHCIFFVARRNGKATEGMSNAVF